MSRKSKNILMFFLVGVLICTSYLTISFAKKGSFIKEEIPTENNGGTMPDKPNGDMSNNGNMENPPEKPSGENNMETSNSNQPPELPTDSKNNDMGNPQNDNVQMIDKEKTNSSISTIYYVFLIIQSLGISVLILYLVMSNFNKKTLKETLSTKDKITIYILSTIILTIGLIFVESYIVKHNILNLKNDSMSPNNLGDNRNISYSSVYEITEDSEIESGEYNSTNEDENAILVSGDIDVTIKNISVEKTGDSDGGDNTSFYGINSAILVKSGANLILKNLTVTTNAIGANGVFSYGGSATTNNASSDGTTLTISDSTITTKKDNSGGIMTTGGGTTNAYNLIINTSGVSSAAIRSDRGGGLVNVDGGTYTTEGSGSPTIYSTAEINVKNATLVSKAAEGIVIEGKNSVLIDNCKLTDSNTKLNGLSTTYKNIFLYQSMSGDADTGNSSFTANNSQIITNNGDTFYVTNTEATINLNNNEFINNDSNGHFLRVKADSWGNSGANGGNVTLIMKKQNVVGNIAIDNISTLKMSMSESSYYEGAINSDNSAKSLILTLDKTSKIKLTGDSYITSLDNEVNDNSNIDFNGYKLYVNGKAIN